mmetsp:Transcript_74096/g.131009  ORF Transcript_74096/g.131009 Transcript_74096/m.131009 type:complete len:294 (-) Transcript_74096:251-1132(-)
MVNGVISVHGQRVLVIIVCPCNLSSGLCVNHAKASCPDWMLIEAANDLSHKFLHGDSSLDVVKSLRNADVLDECNTWVHHPLQKFHLHVFVLHHFLPVEGWHLHGAVPWSSIPVNAVQKRSCTWEAGGGRHVSIVQRLTDIRCECLEPGGYILFGDRILDKAILEVNLELGAILRWLNSLCHILIHLEECLRRLAVVVASSQAWVSILNPSCVKTIRCLVSKLDVNLFAIVHWTSACDFHPPSCSQQTKRRGAHTPHRSAKCREGRLLAKPGRCKRTLRHCSCLRGHSREHRC